MSVTLYCPNCDTEITHLYDAWGCEECGWYRAFKSQPSHTPAEGAYPIIKPTIYHITANGRQSLCGVEGPQIHITYAKQQLDDNLCKECLELGRDKNVIKSGCSTMFLRWQGRP